MSLRNIFGKPLGMVRHTFYRKKAKCFPLEAPMISWLTVVLWPGVCWLCSGVVGCGSRACPQCACVWWYCRQFACSWGVLQYCPHALLFLSVVFYHLVGFFFHVHNMLFYISCFYLCFYHYFYVVFLFMLHCFHLFQCFCFGWISFSYCFFFWDLHWFLHWFSVDIVDSMLSIVLMYMYLTAGSGSRLWYINMGIWPLHIPGGDVEN